MDDNVFLKLKKSKELEDTNVLMQTKQQFVHHCIEKIFKFTVKADHEHKSFYQLKHIESVIFDLDVLDDALMERLGIYESKIFNRLDYLKECFIRCDKEYLTSVKDVPSSLYDDKVVMNIRDTIIRYSITYMLEPEIFMSTFSNHEMFELINLSACNTSASSFLKQIRVQLKPDEYNSIFGNVLLVVCGKLKLFNLYITDPDYLEAVEILNYFTSDESMMNVLIKSEAFLPSQFSDKDNSSDIYTNTLFGLIFKAVCTHTKPNCKYFDIMAMSKADIFGVISSIRNSLLSIYTQMIVCLKRLIVKQDFKNSVYIWLYTCLGVLSYRAQLGSSISDDVDSPVLDCFSANIAYVALKIFEPIMVEAKKLLLRVDPSYCRYEHTFRDSNDRVYTLGFKSDTMLVREDTVLQPPLSFNFPTHWFHLVHKIIHVGLLPAYENFLRLNRELGDAQESIRNRSSNLDQSTISTLQEEQLCAKTQICDPALMLLALEYSCAVCIYLLNSIGLDLSKPIDFDINSWQPDIDKFKYIPDSLLDQSASLTIMFVQLDLEFLIKNQDKLFPLILCYSIFMGSKKLASNPHLRAKLSQAVNYMVVSPTEADNPLFLTMEFLFENSYILIQIVPKSLINLFVDIEFTGHANEFQQKFTYRFHMYKILFFLWKLPQYVKKFNQLSMHVEFANDDTVPIFLKFINLLINDATFLLDEALDKLHKINQLEQEVYHKNFRLNEQSVKKEKMELLRQTRHLVESYNILSKDTIQTLCLLTRDTPKPFLTSMIVDRIASMLNYFLRHLVGEKKRDLKVKEMNLLKFEPKQLVCIICQIFVNLSNYDGFCQAVVEDERSFNIDLPDLALNVLNLIQPDPFLIINFKKCKSTLLELFKTKSDREIDPSEIPEEFLDPISYSLIRDPVMMPASKIIVDRTTIAKHLLSDETDPFNRSHLTMSMLVPQIELKEKIKKWLDDRIKK